MIIFSNDSESSEYSKHFYLVNFFIYSIFSKAYESFEFSKHFYLVGSCYSVNMPGLLRYSFEFLLYNLLYYSVNKTD